ncbi:hypothetical protein SAMN02982918_3593 [Saccharomonospora viridis]|nr:hypothetical protein SAMN02982918_3593 [Saccharomonospora viridis]
MSEDTGTNTLRDHDELGHGRSVIPPGTHPVGATTVDTAVQSVVSFARRSDPAGEEITR